MSNTVDGMPAVGSLPCGALHVIPGKDWLWGNEFYSMVNE